MDAPPGPQVVHGARHAPHQPRRALIHRIHTGYYDDYSFICHKTSQSGSDALCVDATKGPVPRPYLGRLSRGRMHPDGIRPFERSSFVKFRIDRDTFADAVAWTARSLPNRPSVPVLAGLLIETVRRRTHIVRVRLRDVHPRHPAGRGR